MVRLMILCAVMLAPQLGLAFDHTDWDAMAKAHVKGDRVDYAAFSKDARLDAYLARIASTDPATVGESKAQLAFWINAYNAHTVKAVLAHYPGIKSVSAPYPDFGFFKNADKIVGGKKLSLNDIENTIIRPTFKDPRIHAALNCASVSCPPLAAHAFTEPGLDAQLDAVFKAFANDPVRNRIAKDGAGLSQIFNWYKDDFGGAAGVKGYLSKFLTPERSTALQTATVSFQQYDWALNGE
jgi:hypothetical protein